MPSQPARSGLTGTAVRATTQISVAPSNVLSAATIHSDGCGWARLVHHDAEHFPDVLHALEVIALVAQDVDEPDDAPALQFLEAGTDVGASHLKRLDDVVSVERLGWAWRVSFVY